MSKKSTLLELLKEKQFSYPELLKWANSQTKAHQWGLGSLEPYSLEPYRMELSGFKRGKMLKQPSKPGRNRYRYSLDSQGRIIHRIEYTKSLGEPADQTWLHLDDFYLYHPEYVLRFVFGTASDESEGSEVGLTRIVWVDFSNGMPIKTFILEGDGLQYSEESYEYSGNQIVAVRLSWPEGPYQDRNFKILHEAETVRIVELINGPPKKELQIYPARD